MRLKHKSKGIKWKKTRMSEIKKQKKFTKHTQVIHLYALCELVIFKGLNF